MLLQLLLSDHMGGCTAQLPAASRYSLEEEDQVLPLEVIKADLLDLAINDGLQEVNQISRNSKST